MNRAEQIRLRQRGRYGSSINVPVDIDYRPFSHTIRLHMAADTHRERVAVTGSRAGKTTAGVADVLDKALDQPGYDEEDIDRGEPYTIFIGAPTFSMIERVILPAMLRAIPQSVIAAPYNHSRHEISLYGSGGRGLSTIYFMSAGITSGMSDRWKGVKAYGVWLDEFPVLKEQMYDEARTRLLDRQGWLLMTGTPQGLNWAYDRIKKPVEEDAARARKGLPPKRPDLYFASWHTIQNPRLPAAVRDEIERHRQTMPEKYFRRTYEASWDVFEGQIYEEWLEAAHVVAAQDYMFISGARNVGAGKKVVRLVQVVAGVDWGMTHKGAILVLGRSASGVWYVLEESVAAGLVPRGRSMADDSWVRRALALRAKWRIETFYCDPSQPAFLRMFRDENLNVEAADNSQLPGIACVARLIHLDEEAYARGEVSTRLQVLDTCTETIGEIRHYHWKPGSKREEPDKVMDDTMDALRYALYTAEKRGDGGRKPNFDFA